MKLRNKKTGKIVPASNMEVGIGADGIWYDSLAEINEEWEDYKPDEPLIEDEKIRKAVRAWAEANEIEEVAVMCHLVWSENMTEMAKTDNVSLRIVFPDDLGIKMGAYTIAELCGEEE